MHRVPIVGSIKYNSSLLEGSNSIASTKTEDVRYPEEKEASILQYFFEHNEEAIHVFSDVVDDIYEDTTQMKIQNDILVKKLYSNLITKIFMKYTWLHNYVKIDLYQKSDYLGASSSNRLKEFFLHKLKCLYDLVVHIHLYTQNRCLNALLEHILNHPESDLKLKTVAEQVFLNYTYLSSNFSKKLGIHYNKYIVHVKMARAAYLLLNTDMKIYEISEAVSYQDTIYFAQQFRKIYSCSPREYKLGSTKGDSDWTFCDEITLYR